jgi:hypothetical protein
VHTPHGRRRRAAVLVVVSLVAGVLGLGPLALVTAPSARAWPAGYSAVTATEWEGSTLVTWGTEHDNVTEQHVTTRGSGQPFVSDVNDPYANGYDFGVWQPASSGSATYDVTMRRPNATDEVLGPTAPLTPQGSGPGQPVLLTEPHRLVDSRSALGAWGDAPLIAGTSRALAVLGHGGVPVHATAVMLNVSVLDPSGAGTVYVGGADPCAGTGTPVAAVVGRVATRLTWTPVLSAPDVPFCAVGMDAADVTVDVTAYDVPTGGGQFAMARPTVVWGSDFNFIEPGAPQTVNLSGYGAAPPVAATAVLLKVSGSSSYGQGSSELRVYPAGGTVPTVPTLTVDPDSWKSNLALVPLGEGGAVQVVASGRSAAMLQVAGWVTSWVNATPGPAPTPWSVVAGDHSATVQWMSLPASPPDVGIVATAHSPVGGARVHMITVPRYGQPPVSMTIGGLTAGVPYRFTLARLTATGLTAESEPTSEVVPNSGPPPPPTNVAAVPRRNGASVSWEQPAFSGPAATGYTVTADNGRTPVKSCSTPGTERTCTVSGLTADESHTFTVTATNVNGTSAPSAPSNAVVPWSNTAFHAMAPTRVLDSRTELGGWHSSPLVSGTPRSLALSGAVPPDAAAVVMNVTATDSSWPSFVTAYASDRSQPTASNLNFARGQTIANLVTTQVSQSGAVTFANNLGTVHIVVDVVGYYGAVDPGAGLFTATSPTRALDTRLPGPASGALQAAAPRTLVIGAVPATATAVVMNVTVTASNSPGFLTTWPAGAARPATSNLNYAAGQTIPNLVIMKLGPGQAVQFATNQGATHLVVDVVGYFDPTHGDRFHPTEPTRAIDSRKGVGFAGPLGPGAPTATSLRGAIGYGVAASAAVMNTTVTNGTAGSYLTLFPWGEDVPTASNLNFGVNETIANLAMIKLGPVGDLGLINNQGSVHVVGDVVGYFVPA